MTATATEEKATLAVEGLGLDFGGLVALDDVTLEVATGELAALIGPNGAGKTTLFNVCTGFLPPTRGRILFGGEDVTKRSPEERVRLGLARTFQRFELFGSLTIEENIRLAAQARDLENRPLAHLGLRGQGRRRRESAQEVAYRAMEVVGITNIANRLPPEVPAGLARLAEVARALTLSPQLLFLDEPSAGLNERETQRLAELLRRLCQEHGMGFLVVEHDMSLVFETCSTIHVLKSGQLIASGSPQDVRDDPQVRDAYLGDIDC